MRSSLARSLARSLPPSLRSLLPSPPLRPAPLARSLALFLCRFGEERTRSWLRRPMHARVHAQLG
eukprot:1945711-Pleurochrysis_carterae.AAC.1